METAQKRFQTEGDAAVLQPLLAGLRSVRAARGVLRALSTIDESGRFEIEFRLRQKEREFQQAILLAGGIRVEALADDGVVDAGPAGPRVGDRGQPRRRRCRGQAGQARRLRGQRQPAP